MKITFYTCRLDLNCFCSSSVSYKQIKTEIFDVLCRYYRDLFWGCFYFSLNTHLYHVFILIHSLHVINIPLFTSIFSDIHVPEIDSGDEDDDDNEDSSQGMMVIMV